MTKKQQRAFTPPRPHAPPLTDDQVKALAMQKLTDPDYAIKQATAGAPTVAPAEAPTAPATPSAPAEVVQPTAEAPKTPPAAPEAPQQGEDSAEPAKKLAPWEDLAHVQAKALNLPLHPELYMKMVWLTDNLPKTSLQKLAKAGTEAWVNKLIEEHYKP